MEGVSAVGYTFKRKNHAVTLNTKSEVKIDGVAVQNDPQILFQRLIIATKTTENLKDIFKHELCSYPPALFDSSLLLREPQKHVLANGIWGLVTPDIPRIIGEVQYVLDGGALLQRIPWIRGATYDLRTVCTYYVA